ncbi:hypothetical protein LguiB_006328 [Lonicera macranthoides]
MVIFVPFSLSFLFSTLPSPSASSHRRNPSPPTRDPYTNESNSLSFPSKLSIGLI